MVNAEKLAASNPWWTKGHTFSYWDNDLVKLAAYAFQIERQKIDFKPNNIYIIKGPRRTGKTVWLKRYIEAQLKNGVDKRAILYFSFDESASQTEFSSILRQFLDAPAASDKKFLLLDEIQGVDGWDKVLKNLYDSGLLRNVVTVVTGSIAHLLKNDTLPGRGTEGNVFFIKALNFGDVVNTLLRVDKQALTTGYALTSGRLFQNQPVLDTEAEDIGKKLEKDKIDLSENLRTMYKKIDDLLPFQPVLNRLFMVYLRTGGYPISLNNYFKIEGSKKFAEIEGMIYEEIYSYLKNDAAMISGKSAGDASLAAKVIDATLKNLGMKVSFSKEAMQMGMNKKTFMSYFARLENSYAFVNLNGRKKGLVPSSTKKTFFSDIFIHYAAKAASSGMDGQTATEQALNSSEIGKIVEEVVADHLSKTSENEPMRRYSTYLGFYYENSEIDFIYTRTNGSILGIESKYQNEPSTQDVKKSKDIKEYVIITKNKFELIDNVLFVPAPLFLALLKKSDHNL